MSRSRLLLLLFGALILAVSYAWFETPRQQTVDRSTKTSTDLRTDVDANQAGERRAGVGLDFSGGEELIYKEPIRDLFRPLYAEPQSVVDVVAAPPDPEPEEKVVFTPPPPPPKPIERPVALPQPVGKPIPPLKVLGSLQKAGTYTAFLSSPQGEVYLVKQGERFADGLFVRELNSTQIVITRGDRGKGVTLPLTDKQPEPRGSRAVIPQRTSFPRTGGEPLQRINPNSPLKFGPAGNVNRLNTVDP